MPTLRDLTTPKDGWDLVSHFLGNTLPLIGSVMEEPNEDQDKTDKAIFESWAGLVGNLYMIVWRMRVNGHQGDMIRMQEILDMVVERDIRDSEVRRAIWAKEKEFSPQARIFVEEFARLRAERDQ